MCFIGHHPKKIPYTVLSLLAGSMPLDGASVFSTISTDSESKWILKRIVRRKIYVTHVSRRKYNAKQFRQLVGISKIRSSKSLVRVFSFRVSGYRIQAILIQKIFYEFLICRTILFNAFVFH